VANLAKNPQTIDAELQVPVAITQLAHFHHAGPLDHTMRERDMVWLDLCLTPRPRNARACYASRWSPNRFERLGKVFVLPPGESIKVRNEGGPAHTSVLCHLRPEALSEWFDGELSWSDRHFEASLDVRDVNIRNLMLRLGQELRQPGFASQTMVELIAAQIALELRRYSLRLEENAARGGLAPWRLRLIDERLQEEREAPTLTELAALCKLSVRQLTRGFQASRGHSIGQHVANSRLEHAKRMLAGDHSVKHIAYSLGFSSPSSFCCAFRRATLETPGQFRQRLVGA